MIIAVNIAHWERQRQKQQQQQQQSEQHTNTVIIFKWNRTVSDQINSTIKSVWPFFFPGTLHTSINEWMHWRMLHCWYTQMISTLWCCICFLINFENNFDLQSIKYSVWTVSRFVSNQVDGLGNYLDTMTKSLRFPFTRLLHRMTNGKMTLRVYKYSYMYETETVCLLKSNIKTDMPRHRELIKRIGEVSVAYPLHHLDWPV